MAPASASTSKVRIVGDPHLECASGHCFTPSAGNQFTLKYAGDFKHVTSVCLNFRFTDDLFEPGDALLVAFGSTGGSGGFVNVGTPSLLPDNVSE